MPYMMRSIGLALLLSLVASNIIFFCKIHHKYTQVKVFEALLGHYASFVTHFELSLFWVASASL